MAASHTLNAHSTPKAVREAARKGLLTGPTSGLASGYVRVNLVILPEAEAAGFLRFCQANPKPCPLLAISEPGDRTCAAMASDLDIARDVPAYRVYRNGVASETVTDVAGEWRDELVTFALGCSFTFEHALIQSSLRIRHIDQGRNVPMYQTSIPLTTAGGFSGNMVVSMRPFPAVYFTPTLAPLPCFRPPPVPALRPQPPSAQWRCHKGRKWGTTPSCSPVRLLPAAHLVS